MNDYKFDAAEAFAVIEKDLLDFTSKLGTKKVVLGISGGKDSTIIARMCAKILGPENVYGVMLPNGHQSDIADSMQAIKESGITSYAIDISNAFNALLDQLHYNGLKESTDTKINLPPRLRMSTLYAVAQTVGGIVLNTDNLCEILAGYYTIYGDGAGSYGPIRDLTVHEVLELGKWLGVSENLLYKKPGDGLQAQGDEDRLGFTYEDMHKFIRFNEGSDELKKKVSERYLKNKFKTDIVNIPCPKLYLPNYVSDENTEEIPF